MARPIPPRPADPLTGGGRLLAVGARAVAASSPAGWEVLHADWGPAADDGEDALLPRFGSAPDAAVIGPDGLHHTDVGYDCVAAALAEGIAAAVRPAPGVALSRAPSAAEASRPR